MKKIDDVRPIDEIVNYYIQDKVRKQYRDRKWSPCLEDEIIEEIDFQKDLFIRTMLDEFYE